MLSSSLNTMLVGYKHCSDVCCDEFSVPQIDRKSKQVKERWHGKFCLQSVGRKFFILDTKVIKICGWIIKLEANKIPFVCDFSHICKKWMCNFPRWCSNMTKVGWVVLYAFRSKFYAFSSSAIFWKSVKIWQSYRQFKGGNFLRHSVYVIRRLVEVLSRDAHCYITLVSYAAIIFGILINQGKIHSLLNKNIA